MAMYEVTWVDREGEDHASIIQVGGAAWRANVAAVVADIETGRNTYYVRRYGRNFLIAVVPGGKGKYLQARNEGAWTDHLLELPAETSDTEPPVGKPPGSATAS